MSLTHSSRSLQAVRREGGPCLEGRTRPQGKAASAATLPTNLQASQDTSRVSQCDPGRRPAWKAAGAAGDRQDQHECNNLRVLALHPSLLSSLPFYFLLLQLPDSDATLRTPGYQMQKPRAA